MNLPSQKSTYRLPAALFCVGVMLLTPLALRAAEPKAGAPTATASPKPAAGGSASAAPATKPAAAASKETTEASEDQYGHHGQFDARLEFVAGYRMLFRYAKSPRCAPYDYARTQSDQQKFCGFGAAPALGVALGYSGLDFFEPFVLMRFGLSNEVEQTNQGKLLQAAIGMRLYTMSDSRFKIFFSPWLGLDLTSGPVEPIGSGTPGSPGYDDARAGVTNEAFRTDLLAHLDIGPQYDFSKGFGAYLSGGLTFQMLRYLGATADLSLGLQMRAP